MNDYPEYIVLTIGDVTLSDIRQLVTGIPELIDPAVKFLDGTPFILKDGFDEETVAAQLGIPYDEDCRHGDNCLEEGFRTWIKTHVAPICTIWTVVFGKELTMWEEDGEAFAFLKNVFDGADLVWSQHSSSRPHLRIA